MQRRGLGLVATTVLLVLAWGSTFAAVKVGLRSSPPVLYSALRCAVAALVLLGFAHRLGGAPRLRRQWREYAWLSVANVALFYAVQALAIQALPSGMSSVLIYLQPVLVGGLAWRFLDEPLGPAKALGLLLGFAGIAVVSAGAIGGSLPFSGIGYAVATALSWAVGTVLLKRWSDRLDPWWAITVPFAVGTVALAGFGAVTEGPRIDWSVSFVLALLYAGLVGTALAWVLWTRLLTLGEASRAATYIFFVPLVSLVLGAVLLHESLGPTLLAGAVLVGLGVYLANRPVREPAPVSGPAPPRGPE